MQKLYLFWLAILCTLPAFSQDYSKPGFTDPGTGNGTAVLAVPAGQTITINTTRARVTDIGYNLLHPNTKHALYSDLVGSFSPGDLVMIIHNSWTDPNSSNHELGRVWFVGVDPSDPTKGGVSFHPFETINFSGPYDDVQIVKVEEYGSTNPIAGTLTCPSYNSVKKHGGVLAFLVDGKLEFTASGKVDVNGKGPKGGSGGAGGVAGLNQGSYGQAPASLSSIGGDATPGTNTYDFFNVRQGDLIENIDPNCNNGQTEIQAPDGGKGTGKFFGAQGILGEDAADNILDDPNTMLLTFGSAGDGGHGGQFGASAGGNGGGGATNAQYSQNPNGNNTGTGAGHGGQGTNPLNNGGSDANAGDGGNGGDAGGIIWCRAKDIVCIPSTVHFYANGTSATNGESATGQGGTGGHGGKGADGYCTETGSGTLITPAGGNGLGGKGGNGADGGNGGEAGQPGAIWLGYSSTSTSTNLTQFNTSKNSGNPGLGGSGGPRGVNGVEYSSITLNTDNCDCGGNYGTSTFVKYEDCACEENFVRLAGMEPAGTDGSGNKKWEPTGANPQNQYCIWDAATDQLVCYREVTTGGGGFPIKTTQYTSYCGAFACPWVDGWFENTLYGNWPAASDIDKSNHDVTFGVIGSYTFLSGILRNSSTGDVCAKDCDPEDEKKLKERDEPKDGKDGKDGKPATIGQSHFYNYPSTEPFGTGVLEMAQTEVQVYPQPASGQLQVLLPEVEAYQYLITLTDLAGRRLQTWHTSQQQSTLDISHVSSGSYILFIQSQDQTFEKIIQVE